MKRLTLLAILLSTGTLSMAAAAYQAPAQPQGPRVIDIEKLKDNLYVLTSSTPGDPATFSGGNVAVFITDGGVTLVDTKLAGWGQAVLDKVKSVTDKPVTTDHQHPHARRSHRQRRLLRHLGRDRGAGEHQGEHGEDGRLQGRQRQVPAEEDLQGQADARQRQGPHRPLLLRRRPHQRRHVRRLSGAAGPAHRRHVRLEGRRRSAIATTAAAASRSRGRCRRSSPASRTSTRSFPATAR